MYSIDKTPAEMDGVRELRGPNLHQQRRCVVIWRVAMGDSNTRGKSLSCHANLGSLAQFKKWLPHVETKRMSHEHVSCAEIRVYTVLLTTP